MSPWVDDPATGTSYYEKPRNKKKMKAKTAAEMFNESQAARDAQAESLPEESFGEKMARLKREKKAALVREDVVEQIDMGTVDPG